MTAAALALVAFSAALHVAWNLRSRRERPSSAYFALSLAAALFALTPVLVVYRASLGLALEQAWPFLAITAVFSTLYNASLAAAYRSAELSLVYPLARSLAPAGVALVSLALGRGEAIGGGVWLGVPVIILGSVLLPLRSGEGPRLDAYRHRGFWLPLATAIGTAGYTLSDDAGVRAARIATDLGAFEGALLYAGLHSIATTGGMFAWVLATRSGRSELRSAWATKARSAAWVGVVSYVSYLSVLVAMSLARDVSYIAAFRQVGVPLSVLVGVLVLHEQVGRARWMGTALVTLGLVAVAWR